MLDIAIQDTMNLSCRHVWMEGGSTMKLLLTNDDGVMAPGIGALYQALQLDHTVTIVAPHRQRSAASHGFTFGSEYTVEQIEDQVFQCSGSPTDCVMFGLEELGPFDGVISGMNHGANVAWDTWYSGTVGAACEAARRLVPAIAVSLDVLPDSIVPTVDYCYDAAAATLVDYVRQGVLSCAVPGTVLNINFPNSRSLLSKHPQYAVPGSYYYNHQTLVRTVDGPGKWHVHVEHHEKGVKSSVVTMDTDAVLMQEGPILSLLYMRWPTVPMVQKQAIEGWLARYR